MKYFALGACLALGACHSPIAGRAGMDGASTSLPGSSARRVIFPARGAGRPGYSILMPADLELQRLEAGPDPDVRFSGGGIMFEFGLDWDMPSCGPALPRCDKRETIAGREAQSITVDISMPGAVYNRRTFYLFTSRSGGDRTYIDMACAQAACARADAIIRSIEFSP